MKVCRAECNIPHRLNRRTKARRAELQWQVIGLVANHLDPKTLAVASCVCKLWFVAMSSDHLWKLVCMERYPSLGALRLADPEVSYRRLYALGHMSEQRRHLKQPRPLLSMSGVIFAVNVFHNNSPLVALVKPGGELADDDGGVFRFDVDISGSSGSLAGAKALSDLRVTWDVVLGGYKCKFTLLECNGNSCFMSGSEVWYSEELPLPACCCKDAGGGGLLAELRLGLKQSGGGIVVEKISIGLMSLVSWRYVLVVDTLRYLQHFLL